MVGVGDCRKARAQGTRLFSQSPRVPVRGKRLDLKAIRVAQQQIDGAFANRAGRAEYGHSSRAIAAVPNVAERVHRHVRMLRPWISVSIATAGTTASRPSSLSRSPPCPGMSPLESFTPNLRLATDSARSPNCPITARPALTSTSGKAGEIPSHAAVAHPVNPAQNIAPASPAQVFRGLQRGAKRGPPNIRPIA